MIKLAIIYLNRIGDVFYRDEGPLAEIVIIDLPWLCHEVLGWLFCPMDMLTAHNMARMIRFRALAEVGPVAITDIPVQNMIENTSVTTLDVLQAFELCLGFESGKEKFFVFPSLLRNKPSIEIWTPNIYFDIHVGVKFTCSSATSMISPGFFPSLQIVARQKIGPPLTKVNTHFIWERGFICQDDSSQIRVTLSTDSRCILVHVRGSDEGKGVRCLLMRFIDVMDRLFKRTIGLDLDVHVLSNDELGQYAVNPSSAPLSSIIHARTQGASTVEIGSKMKASVRELIALDDESCM